MRLDASRVGLPVIGVAFSLLLPLLAVAQGGARARLTQPIDETVRVELKGHVHPAIERSQDLGDADPTLPTGKMFLQLRASASQEQELNQFLVNAQNPSSADFHRWLTPATFASRFGIAQSDQATLKTWLIRHGFAQIEMLPGSRVMSFSGTLGQLNSSFGTRFHRYLLNGERHLATASNPSLPAALAPVVIGFASLHDFTSQPLSLRDKRKVRPASTSACCGYYLLPADFATIYNLNPAYNQGITGAGRSIAVIGRTNVHNGDILSFRQQAGISATLPTTVLAGSQPGYVSGDQLESDLDLQWSGGIAPGATINFVVAATAGTTDGIVTAASYAVTNDVADIISLSYGSCESATDTTASTTFFNQLWQQAAAQGISVFVASGDSGAAGCDAANVSTATHGAAVNALCSSPYSTCVGGTQFVGDASNPSTYWAATNSPTNGGSALSYIPEAVWNTSGSGLYATGGGASRYYTKPLWQYASGVPSDGLRDVPDVSFNASNSHDTYYVFTSDNATQTSTETAVGGTSASAPAMAGVAALVAQRQGGRLGNFNPVLYGLSELQVAGGPGIFHRIVSGNNTVPGVAGYSASTTNPNYNLATGLGSIDAALLINNWSQFKGTASGLTPTTVTVPASPTNLGSTLVGSAALVLASTTTWSASVTKGSSWLRLSTAGAVGNVGSYGLQTVTGTGSAPLTFGVSTNTATNARQGIITVTAGGNTQTLTVTQAAGTGSGGNTGALQVSVSTLSFASQFVGQNSTVQKILVSNSGNANVVLGAVGFSGSAAADFTQSGSCTNGLSLSPGTSCYLNVSFDPTSTGSRAATLSVGVSGGSSVTVSVAGTGVAPNPEGSDGPLPAWSFLALGGALFGVASKRLNRRR